MHARHARNQLRGMPRRIVREVPKEVLLSDAVTVRASPNSAVEGRIGDHIVVTSNQPRPWQSFV